MAERPFEPVPNTPLVADPTGDAIWKRWLQNLQRFLGNAVRGPGLSTDNAVARWDGTSGQFLNNSGVIIDDSNNVSGIVNLTTTGNATLGDASADTLTLNAGTWTYGANWTATRAAGALPNAQTRIIQNNVTWSADAGGATEGVAFRFLSTGSGSNPAANARTVVSLFDWAGTATLNTSQAIEFSSIVSSSGNVTNHRAMALTLQWTGSGNTTTADHLIIGIPTLSSTGKPTSINGIRVLNIGNSAITNVAVFKVEDQTAATNIAAFESAVSAGTGKTNLNITGTADNKLAGPLYLAQDGKTQQTAAAIYAGTGAPNNANGNNGDFYFRGDGTVAGNTVMYHKEAGAWVAFTTT